MSTELHLFIGLVTGILGLAYFVYGKKQSKYVPLFAGLSLMVYPYFVESWWLAVGIGVFLVVVPFVYLPSE